MTDPNPSNPKTLWYGIWQDISPNVFFIKWRHFLDITKLYITKSNFHSGQGVNLFLMDTVKINLDPNPDLSGLARSLQIDLDFKPWDCNPDWSGNKSRSIWMDEKFFAMVLSVEKHVKFSRSIWKSIRIYLDFIDGEKSRLFWRPFQIHLEGPPPFICQFLQWV